MTRSPEFFTIGVYGKTEEEFFGALTAQGIDTFLDIRQRRAVRGSKYAFVNSKRLQKRLGELGIRYEHILALAPTREIRQLQKEADRDSGTNKSNRQGLSLQFTEAYKGEILDHFNTDQLIDHLSSQHSKKAVLFCVEEQASACHRSIVAERLARKLNINIMNL